MATMADTNRQPDTPARSRAYRWLGRLAIALLVLVVVLAGALGWLVGSESGLRALSGVLARTTAGRLQLEAPSGRLLDAWSVRALRWNDAGQEVTIEQLAVAWSPAELRHGRLVIERLAAASVRVSVAPGGGSSEPVALPASLELPLAVDVGQLDIGRFLYGEPGKDAQTLAENISAAFASDGRTHRLEGLQVQLGKLLSAPGTSDQAPEKLALQAQATLTGTRPFVLDAHASLAGTAAGRAFTLDLRGGGSLERLQVDGVAAAQAVTPTPEQGGADATINGTLQATLTPFATRPLAALRVQMKGIDPALFVDGAPAALLDVDAVLDPGAGQDATAAGVDLAGRVTITNRRAGPLDRQLLPVESLQSRLDWVGERLTLSGLSAALTGGGKFDGEGLFATGQLDLELKVTNVDAHALHSSLLPTKLAGPLRASIGDQHKTLDFDLRDNRYALKGRAALDADAIELSGLQLAYEKARVQADGKLELAGDGRFSAQGKLQNFDPARFLQDKTAIPQALLNADFSAEGALRPALALALRFDLKDSRINGQKLAGQGDIDLLGSRVRQAAVDLDLAGNRLTASGAFGEPGDRLRLQVQASKLETLGITDISGDLVADLTIGGSVAQPELSGEATVKRLQLAKLLDVRDASLNAQLGAGAQGTLAGELRCGACALPAAGVPPLALELKADGVRNRHRLTARVDLPEKRQLRLALAGGAYEETRRASATKKAAESSPPLAWRGTVEEFRLDRGAQSLLALKTPAPLEIGAADLTFGPATLEGLFGVLRIDRLRRADSGWQSTGSWKEIRPPAILAEFPASAQWRNLLGPQSLTLAGEWDLALGQRPSGRVAIWRESGDLTLASLQLGLDEARLQARLAAGRATLTAQIRGTRLGEISAQVDVAGGDPALLFDPQAPLQGTLQARMPDLAWLAPLLGEGWQIAGQVNGEMRLSGSAARPQFAGSWRGEQLAVRALDRGMRLERGQALIDITPEKLLLRRLSFDSELQPLPRILRLDPNVDVAKLTATPGRFSASGELALTGPAAGSAAQLRLQLDRVGVMQLPDQWVAVSGDGEVNLGESALAVGGKLNVDAGLWRLADSGRPSLSDDVVIRRTDEKTAAGPARRALRLDLTVALGRSFHFRGAGVESRLAGQVRIRSDDAGLPRASGTISTADGRFDAYGQKLGIERGIINFQGAIDNPGLNILAVRKNLAVEAGVEVTGTAQRPIIRLVSTPSVPDTEKLSWLVLGRAPDQQGSEDASLLFAAAQTIFGGQGGGFLSNLQQGLGIDEFGVSSGQVGGNGRQQTSQVASTGGFGQSQTVNGQIVSIGKRLSANALLSYEQSLSTTESIVKLTVDLNRQFSVVGRAGSDSAVDFFWRYRFGK